MDRLLDGHSVLLQQGAEARLHLATLWHPSPRQVVIKHRFPKTYRHTELDRRLTAARTAAEARSLYRAAKAGLAVPAVWGVDAPAGILALEPIPGPTVRAALGAPHVVEQGQVSLIPLPSKQQQQQQQQQQEPGPGSEEGFPLSLPLGDEAQLALMDMIGETVARLHAAHLVHGDLTTSNLLLRALPSAPFLTQETRGASLRQQAEVILIDFGLASQSTLAEDKAVDLYVLERAFGSTHPYTPHLFPALLKAYFSHLAQLVGPSVHTAKSRQAKKDRRQNKVANAPGPSTPSASASGSGSGSGSGSAATPAFPSVVEGEKIPAVEDIRRKLEEVRLRGRKRDMTG